SSTPPAGMPRASGARAPRRCAAATDRRDRDGSRRCAPRPSRALRRDIRPANETGAACEMALHEVGALVANERVAVALASYEIGVDLGDEKMLLELRRARDHGAVGRNDLGATPERDPVLMAHAIGEDDVERQVLRVETIHQPARLGGAQVAAFGNAASGARRRRQNDGRAGRGVHVGHGVMPEVLTDRQTGRAGSALEYLETLARAEVTAVVEDAVRRQVDLAVHMDETTTRPVPLRDV